MIANYTSHAANERTFLAWIRTGLAVVAFGFFLIKLNAFVDTVGGGSLPRLPSEDAGAFVAVELVPYLKYPASPPSVGNPATIGRRTVLYFAVIAISVVLCIAAVQIGRRLAPRFGNWNATLMAAAAFIALVSIAYLALPGINEVPRDFPAVVLWRFRLASLGTQAVLWAALGLVFGALTERSLARAERRTGQVPVTRA